MGCLNSKEDEKSHPPAWTPEPFVPPPENPAAKNQTASLASSVKRDTSIMETASITSAATQDGNTLAQAMDSAAVKHEDISLLMEMESGSGQAGANADNGRGTFKSIRTLRPTRTYSNGTAKKTMRAQAGVTLGASLTSEAVMLPAGEQIETWIAMHLFDFFNDIMMLFSVVQEYCTGRLQAPCAHMGAGRRVEYLWAQAGNAAPMRIPAADYIERSLDWIDHQLGDQTLFPQGTAPLRYPPNYTQQTHTICKRIFRIYAHLFHTHFTQFLTLEAAPHLNTAFKWFAMFATQHRLIEARELAPLLDLMERLLRPTGVDMALLDEAQRLQEQQEAQKRASQPRLTPISSLDVR